MKKIHKVLVAFFVLSLLFCACSEGNSILSFDKKYKVLFEKNPNVTSEHVYSKGIVIGKVNAQDITSENLVVINISIEKDKADLIKTGTVFYVENGALQYDTMNDSSVVLPSDSKILGFPSKASLVMFQAGVKTKKFFGATKEKVGEWAGLAMDKANEWYGEIGNKSESGTESNAGDGANEPVLR